MNRRVKGKGKSKAAGSSQRQERDRDLDALYRLLSEHLAAAGFEVRREELKRGPSWSVSSGSCRALDRQLIFIDRRLPQDDQVTMLGAYARRAGIVPSSDQVAALPERARERLGTLLDLPSPIAA